MIIESLIKRAEGSFITIGKDIYHFFTHVKGDPRHLCEVTDEDHIQTLLAIKEGYKIAKPLAKATAQQANTKQPQSQPTGKANAKPQPQAQAPGIGDGTEPAADAGEGEDGSQSTDADAAK
ncbi:hypothetical protein [Bradyrhizobium sp. SZCCHNRI3042]|uniref:hypothetical protein n=1 Tax=Bradyrhizobium sp. SZCCHNRI3042 TaxID=3057291 RepID=UPI002915E7B6|nr:hypothetical protein [Bradyrhizobium sp. SZCCHNRI3042]